MGNEKDLLDEEGFFKAFPKLNIVVEEKLWR
jgi:hypothetical protein